MPISLTDLYALVITLCYIAPGLLLIPIVVMALRLGRS